MALNISVQFLLDTNGLNFKIMSKKITPPHIGNSKGELCFLGWTACIRSHRHRNDACTG